MMSLFHLMLFHHVIFHLADLNFEHKVEENAPRLLQKKEEPTGES